VALILREPQFFGLIHHLIDPHYFSEEYRPFITGFMRHYKKYGKVLSQFELEHVAKRPAGVLFKVDTSKCSHEFYVEFFVNFVRSYRFEAAIMQASVLVDQANSGKQVDLNTLQPTFREVFEADVVRDLGVDYFDTLRDRLKMVKEYSVNRMKTGFPILDKALDGGIDFGELMGIQGETNIGKSLIAINIAAFGIISGEHVLHMTFEMSGKQVAMKYDTRFARMPKEAIRMRPIHTRKIIDQVKGVNGGKLVIQDYRSRPLTVPGLSSMLKAYKLSHGKPGLLVLDYPDLMKSSRVRSRDDIYQDQAEIYRDLRNVLAEHEIRGVVPIQGGRASYGEEIAETKNMAGSIEKAQICDILVALCQTKAEQAKGLMRFALNKNREGGKGQVIRVRTDFARSYAVESGDQNPAGK
jgi:replicative DNA helicase